MPADEVETVPVTVPIRKVDEHGLISNWDDDTRLWLSFDPKDQTIVISGNRAGLNSLARHLLTLTQPDAKSGYNLHWENSSGWFETDEAGLHLSLAE